MQVVPWALGPFARALFSATRPRKRKYKGVEAASQKEREKDRGKNEKKGTGKMEHLMNLRKKLNINAGKPLMNPLNKKNKKEKERERKIDIIVSFLLNIAPLHLNEDTKLFLIVV